MAPADLISAFESLNFTNDKFKASYAQLSKKNKKLALIREFRNDYSWSGGDGTKLEKWQQLCVEVGIADVPKSITQCKVVLHRENINLWDLMRFRMGLTATLFKFPSKRALKKDAVTNRKRMFPKERAKEDGFIKVFLVKLNFGMD